MTVSVTTPTPTTTTTAFRMTRTRTPSCRMIRYRPISKTEGGGTFQSAVDACMDTRNHGQFQRCVAELANAWWRSGMISSRERGMITSAAASSG